MLGSTTASKMAHFGIDPLFLIRNKDTPFGAVEGGADHFTGSHETAVQLNKVFTKVI